jgi:hypothetical protein
VQKGCTRSDESFIEAVPYALAETDAMCSSINLGSTKAGINMDAVLKMGPMIKKTAYLTRENNSFGCAKFVAFANAVEDNPFMAGAFHGVGEADCVINVGVSGPGVVSSAILKAGDCNITEVADIIKARPELTFSVKMRLGWENTEEWTPILDILNDTPLAHIALHPRTGTQQYKGSIHREIFERVYETCRHPLLYNGDLTTLEQLHAMEKCYPRLAGLMIGRGLLARPTLAREYAERREWSHEEHIHTLRLLHSKLMEEYARIVKGEAQLHSKLRPYWEYTEPLIGHKPHKKIMKSGNLRNYLNAIEELR